MSPIWETFGFASVRGWFVKSNGGDKYVIVKSNTALDAYNWTNGFGTKFAAPTVQPATSTGDVKFNPLLSVVLVGSNNMEAYAWSSAGFGTKFAAPGISAGAGVNGVRFNATGNTVLAGTTGTIIAYPWSNGFGTKYAAPAVAPPVDGIQDVAFHPAGNYVTFSSYVYPNMGGYVWSSGFGTKLADPSPTPYAYTTPYGAGDSKGLNFNPTGNAIVVTGGNYALAGYIFSGGFSTKYTNPVGGQNFGNDVIFSPNGTLVGNVGQTAPNVSVFPWSAGFGTKYADPTTTSTGQLFGVSFGSTGTNIITGGSDSPYVHAWKWAGGFGTKYANPTTLPTGATNNLAFT